MKPKSTPNGLNPTERARGLSLLARARAAATHDGPEFAALLQWLECGAGEPPGVVDLLRFRAHAGQIAAALDHAEAIMVRI